MIQALAGVIAPLVGKILERYITDKTEREKIEAEVKLALYQHQREITEAMKEIIVTEAKGNWLQRVWRPVLMLTVIAMVANNYLIAPYVQAFTGKAIILEIPQQLWDLLMAGVGGYIGYSIGRRKA